MVQKGGAGFNNDLILNDTQILNLSGGTFASLAGTDIQLGTNGIIQSGLNKDLVLQLDQTSNSGNVNVNLRTPNASSLNVYGNYPNFSLRNRTGTNRLGIFRIYDTVGQIFSFGSDWWGTNDANFWMYNNSGAYAPWYFDGSGNIGMGTVNIAAYPSSAMASASLYIDVATERLGVNTITPVDKLHVTSLANGANFVRVEGVGDNASGIKIESLNVDKGYVAYSPANNCMLFNHAEAGTGGADSHLVIKEGDVGINVVAPKSTLDINGSLSVKRTAVSATPYTVLGTDYLIGVDTTTVAITLNLPAAATAQVGRVYVIKDEGGNATTNNITVDANGTETIDGALTKVIDTSYDSVAIYTDGSNWFVI